MNSPEQQLTRQTQQLQHRLLLGYCEHAQIGMPEDPSALFDETQRGLHDLFLLQEGRLALTLQLAQRWIPGQNTGPYLEYKHSYGRQLAQRIEVGTSPNAHGNGLPESLAMVAQSQRVSDAVVVNALKQVWRRFGVLTVEHEEAGRPHDSLLAHVQATMADQVAPLLPEMKDEKMVVAELHAASGGIEKVLEHLARDERQIVTRLLGLNGAMARSLLLVAEELEMPPRALRQKTGVALNKLRVRGDVVDQLKGLLNARWQEPHN